MNILKLIIAACFIAAIVLMVGCASQPDIENALKNAGYSNVKLLGNEPGACGAYEWIARRFTAKDQNGEFVSGFVCGSVGSNFYFRF